MQQLQIWYIPNCYTKRYIICKSGNVINFLKCTGYNYNTTCTEKTAEDNHIIRLGEWEDKVDKHTFCCIENEKQEPYFQILIFLKLADGQNLFFHEIPLQSRDYDILNPP